MEWIKPPQILVADDDPVSLHFLASALRELGADVTEAIDGSQTLDACNESVFDLLLLDRRMPDMGGAPLLRELHRRGCNSAAIATSAELDMEMRDELRSAGYVEALIKPIEVAQIADAIARQLSFLLSATHQIKADTPTLQHAVGAVTGNGGPRLLDDGAGLLAVNGDADILRSLRGLLLTELEAASMNITLQEAAMPSKDWCNRLHRLRASCRYGGAMALGEAAARLESALLDNDPSLPTQLRQFLEVRSRTCDALTKAIRA